MCHSSFSLLLLSYYDSDDDNDEYTNLCLFSLLPVLSIHIPLTFHLLLLPSLSHYTLIVTGLYSTIQRQLEGSKTQKRKREANTAVTDPKQYAMMKKEKARKKKEKKEEKRRGRKGSKRGGTKQSSLIFEDI